mmetsp:Transcript_32619/g.45263  ORF Transcript_32619/g.45263 Transcript_32619/m.45263 type:complete len:99 (+) Transcript_32619:282-578(+)
MRATTPVQMAVSWPGCRPSGSCGVAGASGVGEGGGSFCSGVALRIEGRRANTKEDLDLPAEAVCALEGVFDNARDDVKVDLVTTLGIMFEHTHELILV